MAMVLIAQYIGAHIDISWRSTFGNRTFQVGRWLLSNFNRKIATSLHFIAIPACTAVGCNSSR